MRYDFSEVVAAAWTYIQANRDNIDPNTCPHSCIAKERGYPRHRIIPRIFDPNIHIIDPNQLPTTTYDIEIYKPDICYVCCLEIEGE